MPENSSAGPASPAYRDPRLSVQQRVDDLMARMSPAQKLAQINCTPLISLGAGQYAAVLGQGMGHLALSVASGESIEQNAAMIQAAQRYLVEQTPLGIPALVHTEALSGVMLAGATNFPGAIALAATWDADGVEAMGRVIARQLCALGIRHALSPVMDVARDLRWGRIGETYGEDPALAARMSVAFVRGVQEGEGGSLARGAAATGKHFLGYAMTEGGLNTTAERIGPRELREVYARPFAAAIQEAGLAAVMNSYSTLDGVPIIAAPEIFTDLLRGELGFGGMTISDYGSINKLVTPLHITGDYVEAGILALEAGMDVEAPESAAYGPGLLDAVAAGRLAMEAIDRAVRRVLALKFKLGLFEQPYPDRQARARDFGRPEDDQLSHRLAQEAMVLLENREGLLPLASDLRRVAVIGPSAHLLRNLFGGYSYAAALEASSDTGAGPQALDLDPARALARAAADASGAAVLEARLAALYPQARSVRDAIAARLPGAAVTYAQGCGLSGSDRSGFDAAVRLAEQAEVVILVVGHKEGWHYKSCTIGEGFDNSELLLPGVQEELVRAVVATGKPTVLVNVSPRPLSSPWIAENVSAILQAWHPGQAGGEAIADVLFGDYTPGGKLPITAARNSGQIPVYYAHPRGSGYSGRSFWPWSAPDGYVDGTDRPLYAFGHGLSYTRFAYSDLALSRSEVPGDGSVAVSCVVSNTGERAGEEVAQLYITDRQASLVRPVRELAGFRRIHLAAGQSRRVHFTVHLSQLAFLDRQMRWVVEPGEIDVLVGASSEDIRLRGSFTVVGGNVYPDAPRAFYAESSDVLVDGPLALAAPAPIFSLDSTVGELLADEAAANVLQRHIPGFLENQAMLAMVMTRTLRQVGAISMPAVEPRRMQAVAAELAAIRA